MATPVTANTAQQFPWVGDDLNPSGSTLMFCNGIEINLEGAKDHARRISRAFGGRQVFVFHNPTTLPAYAALARSLAQRINDFIADARNRSVEEQKICVSLFVHSHGAVVAKRALESKVLSPENRKYIRVYAFGGATMIPNRLASVVINCLFKEDLVAEVGNTTSDEGRILYRVKKIYERMLKKGENQALEDLRMNLLMGKNDGAQARRYQIIFRDNIPGALEVDPYYRAKVQEYRACLGDYDICLLSGTTFQHPQYKQMRPHSSFREFLNNLPGNLFSLFANAVRGFAAVGAHALTNHQFSAYAPIIAAIAREESAHENP